jgi:cell division septal protein FtsQ
MEEKAQQEEKIHFKKRKVSLFKRRKKSDIRPFAKAKKQKRYKKLVAYFIVFVILIFLIVVVLYTARFFLVEHFANSKNTSIVNPEGSSLPTDTQVKNSIVNAGLDADNFIFATQSAVVIFNIHRDTKVYLPFDNNLEEEIEVLKAVDQQMTLDNKRAIYIDLRYNKPIVKF